MSLRIVYSQDFSIQPRYRKKAGITQDEHDRNVRRLKMFDRAPITPVGEEDGTGREQPNKADASSHTQRANEDTGNDVSAASGSADRLPSYSESSEPGPAPPPYSAGSSSI